MLEAINTNSHGRRPARRHGTRRGNYGTGAGWIFRLSDFFRNVGPFILIILGEISFGLIIYNRRSWVWIFENFEERCRMEALMRAVLCRNSTNYSANFHATSLAF